MGRSATEWTGPTAQPGAGADGDALACVIVNPSKPAVTADFRRRLARALRSAGYRGPVWLDTTVAEPGATQARLAVASGARLVIAVGGDGTVRAVAAGLAGTDVELGVIPLGRETRAFADALGWLNQQAAACCERVTFMAAGLPLHLKA